MIDEQNDEIEKGKSTINEIIQALVREFRMAKCLEEICVLYGKENE